MTTDPPRSSPATHHLRRREVFAWSIYDWANSAYSTLSITILVSYLRTDVLPPEKYGEWGTIVWGWGIGLTMFGSALLSPIVGAIADARSSKRQWLAGTALSGALASCLMFFATPDRPWLLIALFLIANVAIELSFCFYNAFLPEIASDEEMGRVSAWGYGLGYLGGGVALILAIALLQFRAQLGLPDGPEGVLLGKRLGLLLMGLWWGGFTIPTILWLKDKRPPTREKQRFGMAARQAFREVGGTLRNIRAYRILFLFLLGYLIFNDGVQTVISQSSVFAQDVLKMEASELAKVVLMIQFIALPGSLLVGWLADRFGQKPALLLCLAVWITILVAAMFVQTTGQFWLMAAAVALVLGGIQSVSRSIMGLMTPEDRTGEFFGFFNFSGKATSIFGPIFFATIKASTGSAHWALASLLVFFIVGLVIVAPLDIERGRRQARGTEPLVHA